MKRCARCGKPSEKSLCPEHLEDQRRRQQAHREAIAMRALQIAPRAFEAAKHAHDTPTTRYRAALIFHVPLEEVIAAWESLYPRKIRIIV